jgi:3-oxoacyl-[acyl-carrier protein] reductase
MSTDSSVNPTSATPDAPSGLATFHPDLFSGSTTLITGAASGMGRATAELFAALGGSLVLVDIDRQGLDALREELPRPDDAVVVGLDQSDVDAIERALADLTKNRIVIDNAVLCAAVVSSIPSFEISPAQWRRLFDINVVGTFFLARTVLADMVARRAGNLVIVGSDAGVVGGGGKIADTAYAATKSCAISMVRSLSREFAGTNVRVNGLIPGATETAMHNNVDDELKKAIAASNPLRRMGHPTDMAAAIAFLCSPAAQFMYGSHMNVTGGALILGG